MSHHDSIRQSTPNVVALSSAALIPQARSIDHESDSQSGGPQLIIPGQGVVTFTLGQGATHAQITLKSSKSDDPALLFRINEETATFSYLKNGEEASIDTLDGPPIYPKAPDNYTPAIDANSRCVYWISIDSINKVLRFGKGEMRLSTTLAQYVYATPPNVFTKEDYQDPYEFIQRLSSIEHSSTVKLSHAWIEPITQEPPTKVLPSDSFTMTEAAHNSFVTPPNLSPECQALYGNVAGQNFTLNTPDFPDFEQALEYSLRKEDGIANQIIQYKLAHSSFKKDEDASNLLSVDDDYKEVYLRITLGVAQGGSPGIPYVMEIWPPGCGSPIHNHGNTHAIIKVLRGKIDVDLYRMLPEDDKTAQPLAHATFGAGDITYLMPQVNQIHRLRCDKANVETCITIQCYSYAKDDEVHHPTFDYVEDSKLGHFDPISDYDFLKFKEAVKQEWEAFLRTHPWDEEKPDTSGK
ncbi:MAG: cysteine dioxygenase family protein [Bacteroidota bacterium]